MEKSELYVDGTHNITHDGFSIFLFFVTLNFVFFHRSFFSCITDCAISDPFAKFV